MNKKIFSWALYDWANSVFFTTVMAGFFPVFFKMFWSFGTKPSLTTERLGWCLSISGLLLALLAPTLGVLSDKKRLKKKLLFSTMCLGALATVSFYFVKQGDWFSAIWIYGIALFMCSASCVFYDSLMVSVCREDQYDFVSSLGFSLGYLGGGLLFALNVVMFLKPALFGIANPVMAVKWSFVSVAVWWFVFTLPLMFNVPEPEVAEDSKDTLVSLTRSTFRELKKTVGDIFQNKTLFYFILAYWFYIDGVFTMMSMAIDFGMSLGFQSEDLIKALLITQFIGFPSALAFGYLSKKVQNKTLILFCLGIYFFTIIAASQMATAWHFYVLAGIIGLSQGAVQALSRSMYAQLIPENKAGEYFGFFNLLGKFASILGPALMAIFAGLTDEPRHTILSLLILIVVGGLILFKMVNVNSKVSSKIT
jgi:MFS transporter, UMF1 family